MNTTQGNARTKEHTISTSVLVIGTGGSGLRAAIEVAESGTDVLAVGKRPKDDAHTSLAAGGINAALATMDPDDSWQQHAADTIKESYDLANPRTVEIVTQGAEQGIADLERYGMDFAKEDDGRISQRFFGAHTWRRTAFAGDYTGLEIQRTLIHRAEALNVPILDRVYITKLLVADGRVFGAFGFDIVDGSRYRIHADAVILAAGGHNRIWRRTSSRRDENTGDSFRLAVEAGARLRDAELVQFHPSGIIEPENAAGTLVSEAARGEGGILRNGLGERFMERYDPERMELSTRDRVALAAYTEIAEGRGTENGGVWLDVSHLP
ncbi:MAG: FAD-dependent oxidoreductase, partial [Brevibacterium aurantiacum]